MDDLSRFCCLNSECPDHGIRGGGNLSVCKTYCKDGSIRFLRCRSCGDRFSERKATPLFRSHLTSDEATAVLEHIAEGCGVRQTERLVGVHRDTPATSARSATTPGRPTTSWSPVPPRTTEVQFDEKWSFVAKKEAHCDRRDPADDHMGDYWDHVAYDPEHRLVVGRVTAAATSRGPRSWWASSAGGPGAGS